MYQIFEQLKKKGKFTLIKEFIRESEANNCFNHLKKDFEWNNYQLHYNNEVIRTTQRKQKNI